MPTIIFWGGFFNGDTPWSSIKWENLSKNGGTEISHKDNKTYIGYSDILKRRMYEHHNKKPDLIYYETYKNKKDAQLRERKLKQRGQNVRWLKQRIKYSMEE